MAIQFYEALGKTKAWLRNALDERSKVAKEIHAWAKIHGGSDKIAVSDSWGYMFYLVCPDGTTPYEPENWKRHKKDRRMWQPRYSTKKGKALHKEMDALCKRMISQRKILDHLKVSMFTGLHVSSIGVYPVSTKKTERILVAIICDTYKPPKTIHLKRISDIEFEKAVPSYAKKIDFQDE